MKIAYRLQNFAAFSDTGLIDLSPITVLCGANSSGKSSILKSILLIKQSATSRPSPLYAFANAQPLLFNGELTRLGSWADLVHLKERNNKITFEWQISGKGSELTSRYDPYSPRFWTRQTRRRDADFDYQITVTFASSPSESMEYSTYLENITINDRATLLTISLSASGLHRFYAISVSNVSALLSDGGRAFFPSSVDPNILDELLDDIRRLPPFQARTGVIWVDFLGPFPINFLTIDFNKSSWEPFFELLLSKLESEQDRTRGKTPAYVNIIKTELKTLPAEPSPSSTQASQESATPVLDTIKRMFTARVEAAYSGALSALAEFWSKTRYLGPLREQPRRFYQFDDTGSAEIGSAGEFSVQVLSLEENFPRFFSRIGYDDKGHLQVTPPRTESLIDALNYWLDVMGLPRVAPRVIQQSLYELNVSAIGEELRVSLPDVGFGVSQVLPVILECLRANEGDTVILEQPEIHLHPKIQSILADFFIERARNGIRFVIESHSEYLVKRLCRRIAESSPPDVAHITNILFVEREGGVARCERVSLNEFGEIINWPRGFFDNGDDASWVEASLSRRLASPKTENQ